MTAAGEEALPPRRGQCGSSPKKERKKSMHLHCLHCHMPPLLCQTTAAVHRAAPITKRQHNLLRECHQPHLGAMMWWLNLIERARNCVDACRKCSSLLWRRFLFMFLACCMRCAASMSSSSTHQATHRMPKLLLHRPFVVLLQVCASGCLICSFVCPEQLAVVTASL